MADSTPWNKLVHGHQGIPVAISSCLLGELVRFDGQAKKAPWVLAALDAAVRWVSICPEDGAGLGTPRAPMEIFLEGDEHRIKTLDGAHDHTKVIREFCQGKIDSFSDLEISGYVLKSRSPSCGIGDSVLHGSTNKLGDGLMVQMLRTQIPDLPIVSDEDLRDPESSARFLQEISSYWKNHY